MDPSQEKSTAIRKQNTANFQSYPTNSARNVTRGVWELARLHTREAWLCWYPAGMSALDRSVSLMGNVANMGRSLQSGALVWRQERRMLRWT